MTIAKSKRRAPVTGASVTGAPVAGVPATRVPATRVPVTRVPVTRAPGTPAPARDLQKHLASAGRRVTGAVKIARTSATTLMVHLPATVRATRAGMAGTTAALQTLPDSTLRWIAATSVGLSAGLRLAGAPRLVSAAGAAPALLVGAVIALRPPEPAVPAHVHVDEPSRGRTDMTDEHTKGAVTKALGKVEEGLGTLTGDKETQAHGRAKQVQGDAQKGLGDIQDAIQDAIRSPKHKA